MHGGDIAVGVPKVAAWRLDLTETAQELFDVFSKPFGHAQLDHSAEQGAFAKFCLLILRNL